MFYSTYAEVFKKIYEQPNRDDDYLPNKLVLEAKKQNPKLSESYLTFEQGLTHLTERNVSCVDYIW